MRVKHEHTLRVAKITTICNFTHCKVNLFVRPERHDKGYEALPADNISCTQSQEMVQKEECVKVKSSAIQKVIFVLKPNESKDRKMDIYVMNDTYFITDRVRQGINNQSYEAIEHGHCQRFPSDYQGKKGHLNADDTIK
jgi:hypothetical protein